MVSTPTANGNQYSDTEIFDARQLVMERVSGVSLPPGIAPPTLGPISTGLGEIFHYTLSSTDPKRGLDEIRIGPTLHSVMLGTKPLKK